MRKWISLVRPDLLTVKRETVPDSSDGAGDAQHGLSHLSLHAAAHAFVGRSMINSTSPNDPVFFMLHGTVRRPGFKKQSVLKPSV